MSIHNPVEKCSACGERRSEIELLRLVKNKDQILIDPQEDLPGREVYLCPSKLCIKYARENNLLTDKLKTEIDDDIYKNIMEEIGND